MRKQKVDDRREKLSSLILRVVATAVRDQIKDPVIKGVTITDVFVTGDLQSTTIYWSVLNENRIQKTQDALMRATGKIRKLLASELSLRLVPTVSFEHDSVLNNVKSINNLLAEVSQRDEMLVKQRANAAYAGEADPYKKQEADDDSTR
ncbi:MAG: 30S ribosome-binding factor RbfA [Candidatus Ancillula trichonymphae]|jgi:ribosome-binding factor A|nr:30S ribosome-binding factor RbfA [Candidatus Ancillula trichonymphae]